MVDKLIKAQDGDLKLDAPVISDASGIAAASATVPGIVTTGTQTIAGVKTFSSAPVISSASGIVAASATVPGIVTTGAQTIAGVKTFNDGITVNGSLYIPNKFIYQTNSGGSSTGAYTENVANDGDTTNFRKQVPNAGIYRVSCFFNIYTGTTLGDAEGGGGYIKTGPSSTYSDGSNSYRVANIRGSSISPASTIRGFALISVEWTGSLNVNDYIFFGAAVENFVGTGGSQSYYMTIEQVG